MRGQIIIAKVTLKKALDVTVTDAQTVEEGIRQSGRKESYSVGCSPERLTPGWGAKTWPPEPPGGGRGLGMGRDLIS